MEDSYDRLQLKAFGATVGIQTNGAYVSSWQVHDRDLLYVGSKLRRTGIPLLFPHFGKSHAYRMHGFGRDVEWKIVEQKDNYIILEITDAVLNEELQAEYPFKFVACVRVEIESENSLVYALTVKNTGEKALPIAPGVHPYWPIAHADKAQLKIEGIEGFDAEQVDWTENPPDNIYNFTRAATARFPDRTLKIEDISPNGPKISHLVVWSQTPARDPDFDFVCVEPICGVNYQMDTAPLLVPPAGEWEMRLRFSVF